MFLTVVGAGLPGDRARGAGGELAEVSGQGDPASQEKRSKQQTDAVQSTQKNKR